MKYTLNPKTIDLFLSKGLTQEHIDYIESPDGFYKDLTKEQAANSITELNSVFNNSPYKEGDKGECVFVDTVSKTITFLTSKTPKILKYDDSKLEEYLQYCCKCVKDAYALSNLNV